MFEQSFRKLGSYRERETAAQTAQRGVWKGCRRQVHLAR
jgi:hypothetical protein